MPVYYAHSTDKPDKSDWQELSEHLCNVAKLTDKFAAAFGAERWGHCVGLLHDTGKACKNFLARLEGKNIRVDHALFGAKLAREIGGQFGLLLAYIICGHHGGLPDGGAQEGQLHHRLHKNVEEATEMLPSLDCSESLIFPFRPQQDWTMFSLAFFTRMLFSCLVDADFIDTEAFCDPERHVQRTGLSQHDFLCLRASLQSYIAQKQAEATPGKVNDARRKVLGQCLNKAALPQGFFTLAVPTGGGKTLSSLAFAIEHAVQHKLARVIYAIPFTSIIEQNAEVFRQALGEANVLEHHCNYQSKDDDVATYNKWRGLAAENWDVPVVVTTNVQFFESLYSNATSRCRKLHNIAGSVIVLDEAQAIPTEYLKPCLLALRELVAHYRCTIVLCTATQPALADTNLQRLDLPKTVEIVANPTELYRKLKRVRVAFVGKLTTMELAQRLDKHTQVLCIVSTKKQAQQVVSNITNKEGAFHLSTNMYPVHRLQVLMTIRERLADGLICRVIATSLVEAGVDLDFPVVYRAMAGLDAIAQAAGRCNREGKATYGQVYVYEPEEMPSMPWLQRRISRAGETLRAFPPDNCLELAPMQRFFELIYDVENLDAKDIVGRLNPRLHKEMILPFREVANDFRLIDDEGVGVIMPGLPEDSETIQVLVKELRCAPFPQAVGRKLQRYAVAVRRKLMHRLKTEGVIEMVRDTYPILLNAAAYNATMGFCEDMTELWDPEFFVI